MSLTGFTQITSAQINKQYSASNDIGLGVLGADRRGDIWAWSLAGASNLSAGKAVISPAKVSNDTNMGLDSTSNIAVGSLKVTVTSGGSVTADAYAGGYLVINDGTGVGQSLLVSGNSVDYTAGAAHAVDVYLVDGVQTALALADTKASLMPNPYAKTIVHPGSSAGYFCAGVPQIAVTAAYYYWAKVRGIASVLSDQIIGKGDNAILTTNAVAGALTVQADASIVKAVGVAPEATVDAKYYGVYMTLV